MESLLIYSAINKIGMMPSEMCRIVSSLHRRRRRIPGICKGISLLGEFLALYTFSRASAARTGMFYVDASERCKQWCSHMALCFGRVRGTRFLPYFLLNKQLEIAWSWLEQQSGPRLCRYPEGEFGVTLFCWLISHHRWTGRTLFCCVPPCALVHVQGVPLISPTIWAVPSYCLIKTHQ